MDKLIGQLMKPNFWSTQVGSSIARIIGQTGIIGTPKNFETMFGFLQIFSKLLNNNGITLNDTC